MSARLAILLCACLPLLLAGEPAMPAHTATLTLESGAGQDPRTITVLVVSDRVDALTYRLQAGNEATGQSRHDQILAIDYESPNDLGFIRGGTAARNSQWQTAADNFKAAADARRSEHTTVEALIQRANALAQLKRWPEAVATLDGLLAQFPNHGRTGEIMALKGEYLIGAERFDEATKTYTALQRFGGEIERASRKLSQQARITALLGMAEVAFAAGDTAKAAELLRTPFDRVDPAASAEAGATYGRVGLRLAEALTKSGNPAAAAEVWQRLRYQPIDPAIQSRAFLENARILHAAGDRQGAFAEAATAVVRRGGDPAVATQARELARRLVAEIIGDASIDTETKREYRAYNDLLQ